MFVCNHQAAILFLSEQISTGPQLNVGRKKKMGDKKRGNRKSPLLKTGFA
jgi:hypothetical protein